MRSARRGTQLAVFALGGALLAGGVSGCSTTQDKAAAHRAESERILEARAQRKAEKNDKHDADGTKSASPERKSSRQREEKG
ncbi:MAG TPA: hypothetical protein VFN92_03130 [Solirubrobacterales bacterium]|nr:hypothetical protein [Solirubrobacterales bacterium]